MWRRKIPKYLIIKIHEKEVLTVFEHLTEENHLSYGALFLSANFPRYSLWPDAAESCFCRLAVVGFRRRDKKHLRFLSLPLRRAAAMVYLWFVATWFRGACGAEVGNEVKGGCDTSQIRVPLSAVALAQRLPPSSLVCLASFATQPPITTIPHHVILSFI
jgi:hypothetical protein